MRVTLAQLAPARGELARNVRRACEVVAAAGAGLVVLPELFLSGYRVGERVFQLATGPDDRRLGPLLAASEAGHAAVIVGAPHRGPRAGEVANAALALEGGRLAGVQAKRYLPSYGPFEEGSHFTPTDRSESVALGDRRVGLQICYDAFFPEVSRELALGGAELLVVISAAPVTSRRLFEKVLPARAVENAVPLVYVNRVGVDDGVVFGGGSAAWDARGEPMPLAPIRVPGLAEEEQIGWVEIDLDDAPRWRPFRPVLRDVATRPPSSGGRPHRSGPTDRL